ncbi:hypothetical protein [Chitinophaga vietnamensis]|uniref:hypothetical protein n=1 Tax=Chitinophaga vietnamensis TaxID=2593957 RepID=UPI0011779875|nr:hypothetical protein [Chitinophaga vietnamensis]
MQDYIESGIIERCLLGLATPEQEEELIYLRKIYPLLNAEVAAAEERIEMQLFAEAVPPPVEVKRTVLHRLNRGSRFDHRTRRDNDYVHTNTGDTYIHIKPGWNRTISVSIWWRCAFIAVCILCLSLAASTWYLHNRVNQLEDVLIRLKTPAIAAPALPTH